MIYSENTALASACLHIVGNKSFGDGVQLSDSLMRLDPDILPFLTQFFIAPFKSDERYSFFHHSGLEFNFVFNIVSSIFDDPYTLYQASVKLANQLYDNSGHGKIKCGEFYVAYFKDVDLDGKKLDAVGMFKSENKDTYLRVISHNGNNDLERESGININKLDKGCLVFNTNREEGYILAIIDNTNRNDAKYWVEDFLQAKQRSDEYRHTKTLLSAAKSFITRGLPSELDFSKGDQAAMLDRAFRYFKENETFEMGDFNEKVIGDEQIAAGFDEYVDAYLARNEMDPLVSFSISESAVKKSTRSMKSVIKLDKNFHIYVHGGDGMIKKGFDEVSGLEYYQLYFKKEE